MRKPERASVQRDMYSSVYAQRLQFESFCLYVASVNKPEKIPPTEPPREREVGCKAVSAPCFVENGEVTQRPVTAALTRNVQHAHTGEKNKNAHIMIQYTFTCTHDPRNIY